MSNEFFNPSGSPSTGASGSSAPMRAEFTAVAAGFALLPTMAGHGAEVVTVNGSGTSLTTQNSTAFLNNLNITVGVNVQAYSTELNNIANLDATVGILVKTAANSYSRRVLTGTTNEITVTNGNGAVGNMTLSLPSAMTLTGKTVTGGTFNNVTVTNMAAPLLTASGGTNVNAAGTANNVLISDGTNWKSGRLTVQTRQVLTSGTGATYTTPNGVVAINVRMIGGGGGGAAATTNNGTAGNNTTFGSLTAGGGEAGVTAAGAPPSGGTASGGDINIPGSMGSPANNGGVGNIFAVGGSGGTSPFGGSGAGGAPGAAGSDAAANSGSGGGGGGSDQNTQAGTGGGAGGYVEKLITSPSATYTYTVGAQANGGAAGLHAGGKGAAGIIIIDEFYS